VQGGEASASFLKKRSKKLLSIREVEAAKPLIHGRGGAWVEGLMPAAQGQGLEWIKVFLLLFFQKKKCLPVLLACPIRNDINTAKSPSTAHRPAPGFVR
jgi:hypothetical protein